MGMLTHLSFVRKWRETHMNEDRHSEVLLCLPALSLGVSLLEWLNCTSVLQLVPLPWPKLK